MPAVQILARRHLRLSTTSIAVTSANRASRKLFQSRNHAPLFCICAAQRNISEKRFRNVLVFISHAAQIIRNIVIRRQKRLFDVTMMWRNHSDEIFGNNYKTYIDPIQYGGPILPIPIFQPPARTRFRDIYGAGNQDVVFANNPSRHGHDALATKRPKNRHPSTRDAAFSELTARNDDVPSHSRNLPPDGEWDARDTSYFIEDRNVQTRKWVTDHIRDGLMPSHPVTPGLPSELRENTVTDLPKAAFSNGLRFSERASRVGKEAKNVMREARESAMRWQSLERDLTEALRLAML